MQIITSNIVTPDIFCNSCSICNSCFNRYQDDLDRYLKFFCEYCSNTVCGGNRKLSIEDWNKCPKQKAYWEVDSSLFYWFICFITFGSLYDFLIKNKAKKYLNQKTA